MPSLESRKNLLPKIWGQKGSEMGVFCIFSKPIMMIWFHLLGKEDVISLHMCGKFHVQEKNIRRDMGSKGVKNGGFRQFLKA